MTGQTTKYRRRSQAAEVWRRLRKNKRAMAALAFLAFLLLIVIFADVLFPYDTCAIAQNAAERLQSPNGAHWFGTDIFGRDQLARVVHGARPSLLIGLGATAFAMIAACFFASLAVYCGGLVDSVIMRVTDMLVSVPGILLNLSIVAAFGMGMPQLVLAIAVGNLPGFVRVMRASMLTVIDQDYVEAGRAMGASSFHIITRCVLTNCLGTIIVQATMAVAGNILLAASLSFLGVGIQAPQPEWGTMMSENMSKMRHHGYLITIPGVALVLTALSINILGDGLRDAFDPKTKGKR